MACAVSLVTSLATRRPQRWPGGVNLHILPRKLPFHWLSAAAGVSDMHRLASAWFPDMIEVQNGLCGVSGHFLGHSTATTMAWGCESSHFTQETAVPLALYRHGRCGGLRQLVLLPTIIPGGCGMPQLPIRLPVGRARDLPGPEAGKSLSGRLYWRFQRPRGCGCAHPAVRLFPLVPWASGVPRVAHRGAVGIARDPPRFG